jgi:hypothetical protein
MSATSTDDRVTLHLKVKRAVRDQMLGKVRAKGVTMQDFFETLMSACITNDEAFAEVEAARRLYVPPARDTLTTP